jgi:hypothetical protein
MTGTAVHCVNSTDAFSNTTTENGGMAFFSNMTKHGHMAVGRPLPPWVL